MTTGPGQGSAPAPGWYPDPQAPTQMRWWDGTQWTDDTFDRVEPVGGYMAPAGERASGTGQQHPQYGQQYSQYPAQQGQPYGAHAPVTPDGVRLASWGRRVGARVIDGIVVGVLSVALGFPFLRDLITRIIDVSEQQARSGTNDPFAIYRGATLRELASYTLVSLVVSAVYEIGFLLWRRATPGKLLLGLRVRRFDDTSLPAGAVVLRWAAYILPGQVPTVGAFYTLLDVLWPLWDGKRQSLHDKAAGTCVVHPEPAALRQA